MFNIGDKVRALLLDDFGNTIFCEEGYITDKVTDYCFVVKTTSGLDVYASIDNLELLEENNQDDAYVNKLVRQGVINSIIKGGIK